MARAIIVAAYFSLAATLNIYSAHTTMSLFAKINGASSSSRNHWVSDSKATHCAFPDCGKAFSMRLRRHHCRMCGLVFCDDHSSRRLRLDADGKPGENAFGEPQRVCDSCFDKQQAPEHEQVPPPQTGTALRLHVAEQPVAARDRTQAFRMHRAVFNSAMQQATVPVLAAYSKLAQAEVNGPLSSKRVVEWQKDTSTAACQVCRRGFTQLIRRHHCRLCGSVVCAECSSKRNAHPWEGSFSYRSCTSCHHLVSRVARAAEFTSARERAAASDFTTVYAALSAAARSVRREMLLFEEQVAAFGTPAASASQADLTNTQQRLEQWLATLMSELKRFNSIPASGPEATLKELVKRAPAALMKEGMPRFHQLKRQLEMKIEKRKNQPPQVSTQPLQVTKEGSAGLKYSPPPPASEPPVARPDSASSSASAGGGGGGGSGSATHSPQRSAQPSPVYGHPPPPPPPVGFVGVLPPTQQPSSSSSDGGSTNPFGATVASNMAALRQKVGERVDAVRQGVGEKVAEMQTTLSEQVSFGNPFGSTGSTPFGTSGELGGAASDAYATYDAGSSCGLPALSGSGLAGAGAGGIDTAAAPEEQAASSPPIDIGDATGPIPLDEYLIAKRCLVDLSRSSMLYARPQLVDEEEVLLLKKERLSKVLQELNSDINGAMEQLNLDPAEQLREFTAAIATSKQADVDAVTKEELISRLLGVATSALQMLEDDVSPYRFTQAREALRYLQEGLKEYYMDNCIPY